MLLTVTDNNDPVLGAYFQRSRNYLADTLPTCSMWRGATIHELGERTYCRSEIQAILTIPKGQPFLVVTYAHGNDEQIINGNVPVVSAENLDGAFCGALFYATGCLSGNQLGPALISDKCMCFIGYKEEIGKPLEDCAMDRFIACENHIIISLFSENLTINQAFENMRQLFRQASRRCQNFHDLMNAAIFLEAAEKSMILGQGEIPSSHFHRCS